MYGNLMPGLENGKMDGEGHVYEAPRMSCKCFVFIAYIFSA